MSGLLTNRPMMSARAVKIRSAIIGSGSAMLSTTWLMTSALVESTPKPTTTKAGSIVTSRRSQIGMRNWTKPCMIIWPAMVPTAELDIPDAMSDTRKKPDAAAAEQRGQRVVGGLDLGDVAVAGVEGARRHHHHRHVDHARDGERDDDLAVGEPQHAAALLVVAHRRARLGEAGVKIDRVRHHGRADDADREKQRLGIRDLRHHHVHRGGCPSRPAQ